MGREQKRGCYNRKDKGQFSQIWRQARKYTREIAGEGVIVTDP